MLIHLKSVFTAVLIAVLMLSGLVRTDELRAQSAEFGAPPEIRIADNVFLVPDRHARSVTGWLIVKAGCADEADGNCTGIAHYLEHLLFINRDKDHVSKVALFPDGSGNGWTSHRATVYLQRFPARAATNSANLDRLVAYFAGLLQDVRADEGQAERERNVVLQEYFQNTGRNPFARFAVERDLALMPNDPLGQRVIGSPETIRAFTLAAARAFHQTWYARNNAALVIHGPLEAKDVAAIVERHFMSLPTRPVPAHVWKSARPFEPMTRELRSTARDARQTAVYVDRIVTFPERAAERGPNDAAGSILNSYFGSRLGGSPADALIETDAKATDTRVAVSRIRDGALRVSFTGVPATGVAADELIRSAKAYLDEITARGLTPAVVERLKTRITNERKLLAAQPAAYASALTNWLSAHGTWDEWQQRQVNTDGVTADAVNRLLKAMAASSRELVAVLEPAEPIKAAPGRPSAPPSVLPPQE